MPSSILDSELRQTIAEAQEAARRRRTQARVVDGVTRVFRRPFPSPGDWRQCWIYFLLLDRFNNPDQPPAGPWNQRFDYRQGGTFRGVQAQLGYLEAMGVKAIWLSPVLKNSRPDWRYNYHGYGAQDFVNLDARFASDGTQESAGRELEELVNEAHARGIYVILDIVLNHSARVFDYVRSGRVTTDFADASVLNGPPGTEPAIRWLNGLGFPREDWENRLDPSEQLHPDDAVWPTELQNHLFFRRRGSKLGDTPDASSFVRGDFGSMRQLVVEYDAGRPGQESLRSRLGVKPVLNILIQAHAYLVARYDFDGFRIDTVKYVDPEAIETFGNAMREFAFTLGKHNFFTFAEVYDNEETIARFTGRNGGSGEGFGVDAALDFPLFYKLPDVAKGLGDVSAIRQVFLDRKAQEQELLSSHGEAGRFFVSFLDNHDQKQRIRHPQTPDEQVTLALGLLFTLQGIPCIYYGTEQDLAGTVTADGAPDLAANESTREALWGKHEAFTAAGRTFSLIRELADLRRSEPALSFGRLYFRPVSGNAVDFGQSKGAGGLVAFSRILFDREILVVANTGPREFNGWVLVDRDLGLGQGARRMTVKFSNQGNGGTGVVRSIDAQLHDGDGVTTARIATQPIVLAPHEIQVLTPV